MFTSVTSNQVVFLILVCILPYKLKNMTPDPAPFVMYIARPISSPYYTLPHGIHSSVSYAANGLKHEDKC